MAMSGDGAGGIWGCALGGIGAGTGDGVGGVAIFAKALLLGGAEFAA